MVRNIFTGKLESKKWRKIVLAAASIVEDSPINLTKDGLIIRAMNIEKVMMVDIFLPSSEFEEFELEHETVFGANFVELRKIMSRIQSERLIKIMVDENNIRIKTVDGVDWKMFSIPQVHVTDHQFRRPSTPVTAFIRMEAEIFSNVIKDASILTDHLVFEATEDELLMWARGSEGTFESSINKQSLTDYKIECSTKSAYALIYLQNIVGNIEYEVSLSFGENQPLVVETEIGSAETAFIIAARVEEE